MGNSAYSVLPSVFIKKGKYARVRWLVYTWICIDQELWKAGSQEGRGRPGGESPQGRIPHTLFWVCFDFFEPEISAQK